MTVRPLVLKHDELGQVCDQLAMLIGRSVKRVLYGMSERVEGDFDFSSALIHEVDLSVVLDFDGIQLRVDWAQSGSDEGLALQFNSDVPSEWVWNEVRTEPGWASIIGSELIAIDLFWHHAESVASKTVLGIRFRLSSGRSVTIALGEIYEDQLSYIPDNLVVAFADSVATTYLDASEGGNPSL
jgi:hypothetical protein